MLSDESRSATRILLVEDEAIIALDLKQRLEGLGYEVTGIAATGAEALSLAQETGPTLVFMDITIQGPIDGIETATRLSNQMDVPVVFLTAHTDTGTFRRARAACPYGFLVKPFDERELAATIEMAVYRHKTEARARLLQAQKVEAMGQLAGGVARDLDSILAVITAQCQMVRLQVDAGHPVRPGIDQILGAASRAADLTRQLLAFSREHVLQSGPLDLKAIVGDLHTEPHR